MKAGDVQQKAMMAIRWVLYPPIGEGGRETLALVLLSLGVPRVLYWPSPARVEYLPSVIYGWLLCAVAVLLLATIRYRYGVVGKMVAVLGVFVTATIGVDALPSKAAALLYLALCFALIGQAGMVRHAKDC